MPDELQNYILDAKLDKKTKSRKMKVIIVRVCICFLTFLCLLIGGFFGAVSVISYGPSTSARDLFVVSVTETSAAKFLATWFFNDDDLKKILSSNTVEASGQVTDPSLITFPQENSNQTFDINKIEVVEVSGDTYKGKMLVINDPSRVFVGTCGAFGTGLRGKKVMQMVADEGCIAGINAGGFEDNNGVGKGGEPIGLVFSKGKMLWGDLNTSYDVIGFDINNKLNVGSMTGQAAKDKDMRDIICFGPALIINNVAAVISGTGGGLNPRSAIGQRSDGAVLLLVIEGRQANSLGATYGDLIYQMQEFGAVNAANLDGGMSSHMVYKGEVITKSSSLYGPRDMPTAILVK